MPRSVIVGVLVIGVVAIIVIAAVISANVRYRLELEPPAQYNHRYARALQNAVTPPIIARLIDATLMELMTVTLDGNNRTILDKTGYKYR